MVAAPLIALWCHHSIIKAEFLMPETIIVIISMNEE